MFKTFRPQDLEIQEIHSFLLSSIAPRPIAFVSTVDAGGRVNLSPFSFFNVFSANPPILVFSPARRGRDNTVKHTLENVLETKEAVINIINFGMVHQASLASHEFDKGVNEFAKSGFREEPSLNVRPPRVYEAPVSYECKVVDVIPLGKEGGAGNLVICEVVCFHVRESYLQDSGRLDDYKLDLVGRMGASYYAHASPDAMFEIAKPSRHPVIGVDNLPHFVMDSEYLNDGHRARLASMEDLPSTQEWVEYYGEEYVQEIMDTHGSVSDKYDALCFYAAMLLEGEDVRAAACVLFLAQEVIMGSS